MKPPQQSIDRPTFTVTLRAEAGADANSVLRSLRRFLKAAKRSYHLTCIDIKPIHQDPIPKNNVDTHK
tara:strand:+ start:8084 stop:8287 length:204 start_codon:yes stop_codon:yes gene_type:complete